jgi:hypothetical protein
MTATATATASPGAGLRAGGAKSSGSGRRPGNTANQPVRTSEMTKAMAMQQPMAINSDS